MLQLWVLWRKGPFGEDGNEAIGDVGVFRVVKGNVGRERRVGLRGRSGIGEAMRKNSSGFYQFTETSMGF